MATHSSFLAWRLPWTEKPGRLQSIGSQGWTRLKRLSTHARKRNMGRVHLTDRWFEEVQVIHCGQDLGAARDSKSNWTTKLSVT